MCINYLYFMENTVDTCSCELASTPQAQHQALRVEMLMNSQKKKSVNAATLADADMLISLRHRFRVFEAKVLESPRVRSDYPSFLRKLDTMMKDVVSDFNP